jgi:hypothetical protein
MEIYYDWEFLENGETIRPISLGMIREDGEEYYAIVNDALTIRDASLHPWLKANVLPYLPLIQPITAGKPYWDTAHPDYKYVKRIEKIADEVKAFIREVPDPQLWAYFAAYDHVCLAQLWGVMVDMPIGIPQRTNDVAQELGRLGYHPGRMEGLQRHNALSDAKEVKWLRESCEVFENLNSIYIGGR